MDYIYNYKAFVSIVEIWAPTYWHEATIFFVNIFTIRRFSHKFCYSTINPGHQWVSVLPCEFIWGYICYNNLNNVPVGSINNLLPRLNPFTIRPSIWNCWVSGNLMTDLQRSASSLVHLAEWLRTPSSFCHLSSLSPNYITNKIPRNSIGIVSRVLAMNHSLWRAIAAHNVHFSFTIQKYMIFIPAC